MRGRELVMRGSEDDAEVEEARHDDTGRDKRGKKRISTMMKS